MSSPPAERAAGQVIRVGYREPKINALLQGIAGEDCPWTRHFNQNEEFFVELTADYSVPSLPIHHDVREARPADAYVDSLCDVVRQLIALAPGMLKDVTYAFDPADVLKAHFHRVYKVEGRCYLYLLTVDLAFRAQEHSAIARGTNDMTAPYRGRRLFLESLFVPVDGNGSQERSAFGVQQSFSQTWLGERGRGYFVQGIWIDHDLTKFFTKLFLPAGLRVYPFYPFVCRYRTICETAIDLAPSARRVRLPFLHRALDFIAPELDRIEREMRNASFSEDLPLFRELKQTLPPAWDSFHKGLKLRAYLNPAGMREFAVESADA